MALSVKQVKKKFGALEVIQGVSLEVTEPEIICIVGPSGCGKSTLLNIIGSIDAPDSGSVENTYEKVGYVFQEDRLLPWRNVGENIRLVNHAFSEADTRALLEALELEGFENAMPDTLSGGMRQRVAIARAFAYGPDLMLMDEPLKSLDLQLRLNILKLLQGVWRQHKCAILYVTHEIDEALLLGDRIVVMEKRPSKIKRELEISIPREQRQFGSSELDAYRQIIISELFSNEREDK